MDQTALNKKINRLYRQLGKEVYQHKVDGSKNTLRIEQLIEQLSKSIQQMDAGGKTVQTDSNQEKVILTPEKDATGFGFYVFCKHCRVGNNPKSTHCIRCGEKLFDN